MDKDLRLAPAGFRLLVCDACWGEHAAELVIVPGDHVVVARCGSCGAYGNPRGFARPPRGAQGRLLGHVPGVCGRGTLMGPEKEPSLPPAFGWTGATQRCGRCAGRGVGWWPTLAPKGTRVRT